MTETGNRNTIGRLLIVDDDEVLADRLALSLGKRGFETVTAYNQEEALNVAKESPPDYALVDMRIGEDNGLELAKALPDQLPGCRIVILTAFGNIATAVAAVKAGAIDYLAKPADPDSIVNALLQGEETEIPAPPAEPMNADRVRWEHILRVYEQNDRNMALTARLLKMHRRSLQRIINKFAPREDGLD